MKKFLAIALLAVSSLASAADVGVSVGRDYHFKSDVVTASVGTQVAGFGVSGNVSVAPDTYKSVGVSVSKEVLSVAGVAVAPHVGVDYLIPQGARNGLVSSVGVAASYPLTKSVSLVADASRRFNLEHSNGVSGNLVTVGLKTSF